MLDGRHERLAKQIQSRINDLEAERTEAQEAEDRASTERDEITSATAWWQRNWFFSWVGNDREAYDRLRPLRSELRRLSHKIAELDTELSSKDDQIDQVVHEWLAKHHRGYRELLAKQEKTASARGSCTQLRNMAAITHRRIGLALSSASSDLRDDAARTVANRHASEVSQHVQAVRKMLTKTSHDVRPYGSLDRHVRKLNFSFSGYNTNFRARLRELTEAQSLFMPLDRDLMAIIRTMEEEEKAIVGQLVDIRAGARAHFT